MDSLEYSSDDSASPDNFHDVCMPGMPLELVHLAKGEDDTLILTLNEETLNSVLETTKGRPLVALTIAGPVRLGKSFLLNHLMQSLDAMEGNRNKNNDETKPLTGFTWKHGIKPDTKGIWIWSRAFLVDTFEDEVAVLLMDTQGIDDECPSPDEIASILGISTLLSSVLILNFSSDFPVDVFSFLAPYLRYGKHCLDQRLDEKPFQSVSFVIRDWNSPGDYPFGMEGGEQLLEDKLQLNSTPLRGRAAREYREVIGCFKKCFEKKECYLMPNIGEKALNQTSQGSMADMSPDFIKCLRSIQGKIINGDDGLPIKSILGTQITATEFKQFFSAYIAMINSSNSGAEDLTSDVVWNTTAKVSYENALASAMNKYHEVFRKKQASVVYLQHHVLDMTHLQAKRQAMLVFQQANALDEFQMEYEKKLTNLLDQAVQDIRKKNEQNRNSFVAECIREASDNYTDTVSTHLNFYSEALNFYDEAYLRSVSERSQQTVTKTFVEKFGDEPEETMHAVVRSLSEVLNSILDKFLKTNYDNLKKAENIMERALDNLQRSYADKMMTAIEENPCAETALLNYIHTESKRKTLKKFGKIEKPGTKEFQKKYELQLINSMDDLFFNMGSNQALKLKETNRIADELIHSLCQEYTINLRGLAEHIESKEELQRLHKTSLPEVLQKFSEGNPFPPQGDQSKSSITKLTAELEAIYKKVEEEGIVMKKRLQDLFAQAVESSFKVYQDAMENVTSTFDFLEEEDLLDNHKKFNNEAFNYFTNQTNVANANIIDPDDYKLNLKQRINQLFTDIQKDNQHNHELALTQAEKLLSGALKMYQEQMRGPSMNSKTQQDFDGAHLKASTEISQHVRQQLGRKSEAFKNNQIGELKTEIGAVFMELKEIFELKRNETELAIRAAIEPARKYYHEEMQKHMRNQEFLVPSTLLEYHNQVSQAAVMVCSRESALKETQQQRLREELEKSFKKWNDENMMALNWDPKVEPAIGIDLGTTYCCSAVFYKKKVIIIRNGQGKNTTPSYVAYEEDGSKTIGEPAKENAFNNPENTVFDAKRIIGRTMDDEKLKEDMKFWPFTVVQGEKGPAIDIRGEKHPPEQISATLLRHLRQEAEKQLQRPVKKAVITVPAYFNDGQRQATLDAGFIAGLDVLAIINEPTAAAMAYKLERFDEDARKVLIYDLGGGTFDVAVLETVGGHIEMKGLDGDTHLGGEDFDKNMMTYCLEQFQAMNPDLKKLGVDIIVNKDSPVKLTKDTARKCIRRIQTYCEKAKQALAAARFSDISIDSLIQGKNMQVRVTREKFEELNASLFEKTIEIVDRTLRDAGIKKEEIDDIVLVGGSTRIPKIQEMLSTYFHGKALNRTVHPDEAVAYGAAIFAAMMNGTKEAKKLFSFQDVTPMSLGIEAQINNIRGRFSVIIPKNTKIPTTTSQDYYTAHENQRSVDINIYQGECPTARNNTLLGHFNLDGIPKGKAAEECIDVIMKIDLNGILNVEAKCRSTGKSKKVEGLKVKEEKGRLSNATKHRLLAEAEAEEKGRFT